MTLMRKHGSHPPSRLTYLEHENARLREALEPFAKAAKYAEPDEADEYTLYGSSARHELTLGHLRKARAALTAGKRDV